MARVLVIDDDPLVLRMLVTLLEAEGYEVSTAADGQEGTECFREHPADLVVTDIIMPEKEGIQTILDLRREFPHVKIIALSGGGSVMTADNCLHLAETLGAERTFSKPFENREFLEAVRSLIER